jgi:hypothetical protein
VYCSSVSRKLILVFVSLGGECFKRRLMGASGQSSESSGSTSKVAGGLAGDL